MSNIVIPILSSSGAIKISDMRTLDNNVVHVNGNETITGTKTFGVIYVNNIYSSDGNTLIRQIELNNYNNSTSTMDSYNLQITSANIYTNIPLTDIIKTNIPNT